MHKSDNEVMNARRYITAPHLFFEHSSALRTVFNYLSPNSSVFCTEILNHFKVNIIQCFNSEIRLRKKILIILIILTSGKFVYHLI